MAQKKEKIDNLEMYCAIHNGWLASKETTSIITLYTGFFCASHDAGKFSNPN